MYDLDKIRDYKGESATPWNFYKLRKSIGISNKYPRYKYSGLIITSNINTNNIYDLTIEHNGILLIGKRLDNRLTSLPLSIGAGIGIQYLGDTYFNYTGTGIFIPCEKLLTLIS